MNTTTPQLTTKKYQADFDEFTQITLNNPKLSECQKLDTIRMLLVSLGQQRDEYWTKPCLRNWPCLWVQDHSEIDKLREKLAPVLQRCKRDCIAEINGKGTKAGQAAKVLTTTSTSSTVSTENHAVASPVNIHRGNFNIISKTENITDV